MTIAKVISVLYKIEDCSIYVYVTLKRREPINDTFIMRFYSPKKVDNFCMLESRLRGLNVKAQNKTEFESIYKTARIHFSQATRW